MNVLGSSESFFARIRRAILVAGVYGLLYVPIVVFFIFSFNNASFPSPWVGFTTQWYHKLFEDTHIWQALYNSLLVAFSSVALSVILGVLLIFFIVQGGKSRVTVLLSHFYLNLMFPEIILAVGLLGFFMIFSLPLGMISLVVGHTVLGLGYVVPIVYSRYCELDYRLIEASYDLGATPLQTFFSVTLPLLVPSLVAASILVFIVSFDDFVIAYFCAGSTFQTLPLYILSMLRTGISPVVNALSSILLLFGGVLILVYSSITTKTRVF